MHSHIIPKQMDKLNDIIEPWMQKLQHYPICTKQIGIGLRSYCYLIVINNNNNNKKVIVINNKQRKSYLLLIIRTKISYYYL